MLGAGSVTPLAGLALASPALIPSCYILCENILVSVSFYSINIFSMLDVKFMYMHCLHIV